MKVTTQYKSAKHLIIWLITWPVGLFLIAVVGVAITLFLILPGVIVALWRAVSDRITYWVFMQPWYVHLMHKMRGMIDKRGN